MNQQQQAIKKDEGKPMLHLVEPIYLEALAVVREFGNKKYGSDNWKEGKGLDQLRLYDSLMRHLLAYIKGEDIDQESGLPHLAHVGVNNMFMYWNHYNKPETTDNREKKRKPTVPTAPPAVPASVPAGAPPAPVGAEQKSSVNSSGSNFLSGGIPANAWERTVGAWERSVEERITAAAASKDKEIETYKETIKQHEKTIQGLMKELARFIDMVNERIPEVKIKNQGLETMPRIPSPERRKKQLHSSSESKIGGDGGDKFTTLP